MSWRRERNATATGELLQQALLTVCCSVTLPSPLFEDTNSPRCRLLRIAGNHTPANGSHLSRRGAPRQDALVHICRPRSSTHDKEAPQKLLRVVVYTTLSRALGVQGIYRASISNICSAVAGTAYVVCTEPFILWLQVLLCGPISLTIMDLQTSDRERERGRERVCV